MTVSCVGKKAFFLHLITCKFCACTNILYKLIERLPMNKLYVDWYETSNPFVDNTILSVQTVNNLDLLHTHPCYYVHK